MKENLTGQLIFRLAARDCRRLIPNDDRQLYMVFGAVAVPKDFEIKDEHQYEVAGVRHHVFAQINIVLPTANDVSEITRGNTPGGILKMPIWRI